MGFSGSSTWAAGLALDRTTACGGCSFQKRNSPCFTAAFDPQQTFFQTLWWPNLPLTVELAENSADGDGPVAHWRPAAICPNLRASPIPARSLPRFFAPSPTKERARTMRSSSLLGWMRTTTLTSKAVRRSKVCSSTTRRRCILEAPQGAPPLPSSWLQRRRPALPPQLRQNWFWAGGRGPRIVRRDAERADGRRQPADAAGPRLGALGRAERADRRWC